MARLLAFVLFGLAIAAVSNDLMIAADKGKDFYFLPIGQYWFDLHPDSLMAMQPQLGLYGLGFIWDSVIFPLLEQPAAPALAIFAVILWILGGLRRRARKPRPSRIADTNNKSPSQRHAPARRTGTPHAGPHRPVHTANSGPVRRMR